jgi:2-isopropylmalate synthase
VQAITDETGKELSSAEIHALFEREYVEREARVRYIDHRTGHGGGSSSEQLTARLAIDGAEMLVTGSGNGPVDAFVQALREHVGADVHVLAYHEHATGAGEDATAVAYVQLRAGERAIYGAGVDPNIVTATLKAVTAALDRGIEQGSIELTPPSEAAAA